MRSLPDIIELDGAAARAHLDGLAAILVDCVEGGASVSFMSPFGMAEARAFWRGVADAVESGRTRLFAAFLDGEMVGTVQLALDMPANQPHRGEVRKMLVRRAARRRGVAEALMRRIERAASESGRSLLVLDTVAGAAGEGLYRKLGWEFSGTIPDYALWPDGRPCATSIFYKRIALARLAAPIPPP